MKIAIISDLHANLPALKAVLADISFFNPDQIYCLGDLTDAAPWHNEVIELIKAKHIPTIMGNHDERIAFDHPVYPLTKHNLREQKARLEAINYTKQHIMASNKAFLAALPATIKLESAGMTILLVHGSPDSNEEYLYEDTEESRISEMFRKAQVEVIISGHTHVPFIRYLSESPVQNLPESKDQNLTGSSARNTKLLINTGSVGRSKEKDRKACYLQLEILSDSNAVGIDRLKPLIRKIAYPIEETIRGIRSSPVPDFYADFLENTPT